MSVAHPCYCVVIFIVLQLHLILNGYNFLTGTCWRINPVKYCKSVKYTSENSMLQARRGKLCNDRRNIHAAMHRGFCMNRRDNKVLEDDKWRLVNDGRAATQSCGSTRFSVMFACRSLDDVGHTYWCLSLSYSDYARSQVEIIPVVLPLFTTLLSADCRNFLTNVLNYEGRPINKLQNGIILLIFKI